MLHYKDLQITFQPSIQQEKADEIAHAREHTEEWAGVMETYMLRSAEVPYLCVGSGGSWAVSAWIQSITGADTKQNGEHTLQKTGGFWRWPYRAECMFLIDQQG